MYTNFIKSVLFLSSPMYFVVHYYLEFQLVNNAEKNSDRHFDIMSMQSICQFMNSHLSPTMCFIHWTGSILLFGNQTTLIQGLEMTDGISYVLKFTLEALPLTVYDNLELQSQYFTTSLDIVLYIVFATTILEDLS